MQKFQIFRTLYINHKTQIFWNRHEQWNKEIPDLKTRLTTRYYYNSTENWIINLTYNSGRCKIHSLSVCYLFTCSSLFLMCLKVLPQRSHACLGSSWMSMCLEISDRSTPLVTHRSITLLNLTLRNIDIWMSKNWQKLDI